jgi:hypothetical protein
MMTSFETHVYRQCRGCCHWDVWRVPHEDGYVVGLCREPPDERDRTMKRGSDGCSRWKRFEPSVLDGLM